jgi:hypothetical protein
MTVIYSPFIRFRIDNKVAFLRLNRALLAGQTRKKSSAKNHVQTELATDYRTAPKAYSDEEKKIGNSEMLTNDFNFFFFRNLLLK